MKMTIKTGDTVLVIAGKDKGKTGKVSDVFASSNKVLVEDINMVTKHQKPKSAQDKGGIIKKNAPIDASNVLVVCPVCGKATRVAHKEVDGKKVRICKKCGASLDKEYVKQTKKEAKKAIKAEELKGAKLKKAETKTEEEKPAKTTKKTTAKTTKTTEKTAKSTAKSTVSEKAKSTKTTKTAKSSTEETKKTTKKSTTAKKEEK
jgi:large subunit ribosomal protein L24